MGRKTMHGAAWTRARRAAAAGLLWACASGACAAAQRAGAQGIPDAPPADWSIPDDSVRALFDRSNLVIVHERTSGPYPANLVLVAFRPGTTPAQRAQAIAAVQGSLVGGNRAYYIVRVEARCGDRPVWCAIDLLEPLPQVEEAHPYLYGGSAPATDFEQVETIVEPKPPRADRPNDERRRPGCRGGGFVWGGFPSSTPSWSPARRGVCAAHAPRPRGMRGRWRGRGGGFTGRRRGADGGARRRQFVR